MAEMLLRVWWTCATKSSGIDAQRLTEITAEPRRYGFHGTLKAPIALADEVSEGDFLDAVGRFSALQRPLTVPSLKLRAQHASESGSGGIDFGRDHSGPRLVRFSDCAQRRWNAAAGAGRRGAAGVKSMFQVPGFRCQSQPT